MSGRSRDNTAPDSCSDQASNSVLGLLLCRDLIFISKIVGTAAELGYQFMIAGSRPQAKSLIETKRPQVVLIDLTTGEMAAPAALGEYQRVAASNMWFVAFGPHVDVNLLSAAKAAGCHVVLPRSRFTAELPALMRRYFSETATRDR
jgi:DNA-binding NtrC family response regulator